MITALLLEVVAFLVRNVLGLFPSLSLPDWLTSYRADCTPDTMGCLAYDVGTKMASVDDWMPVRELLDSVPVVLTMTLALAAFKFGIWVASWLRGGGGSS